MSDMSLTSSRSSGLREFAAVFGPGIVVLLAVVLTGSYRGSRRRQVLLPCDGRRV